MSTRVSIIIVTWNGLDLLKRCLPSVVRTDYQDFEIIVSDNDSTDDSVQWIRDNYPQVRILENPENYAFCRGNNEAIKIATGEYVVLLNNDVEVPPSWLQRIVGVLDKRPEVGAVQPKLLQIDKRDYFEYSGGAGGHLDKFGFPFTRGRIFFSMEQDHGQYDSEGSIFWASGAAIAIRREVLSTVGLLDEQFVLHMEEIDLCWRLRRAGFDVVCEPSSEVYHIGGASLPASSPQKTYYNYRNGLLLLYKNLPPREWAKVFPVRFLLDMIAVSRNLLTLKPRDAWAIIKAYTHAHKMKASYRTERPGPEEQSVLPDYRKSVVVDYFIRGRKKFDDLDQSRFTAL